jgi:hypothetical protein
MACREEERGLGVEIGARLTGAIPPIWGDLSRGKREGKERSARAL